MGWAFHTLQNEIESVKVDIIRCEEMIRIEKQSIKEMRFELARCHSDTCRATN